MNNIKWFKVFIICLVVITLGFLSWQLIAQIETANSVRTFLQGSPSCPNLVDMNGTVIPNAAEVVDLTMKDTCTGLVWMRRPLPNDRSSAAAEDDVPPGYTWAMAKSDCEAIKISTGGPSLFRLPTVEELMSLVKIQCPNNIPSNTNNNCTILSDYFPDDITVTDRAFANGYFWSINDFNEAPSWKTDNAGRDYKRSVNLLTGQADSPVFGKDVLLNAWCIVDRQPEIIEQKFTSLNTQVITGGSQIINGILKSVYNRKCTAPATDDCSSKWTGASCDATSGYCSKTETIDLAAQNKVIAVCSSGYHVEGSICVVNTAEQNCGNSRIDGSCSNTSYTTSQTCLDAGATWTWEACDDGSYNGTTGYCIACTGCGVGYTIDSVNHKCVPICGDGSVNSPEVCDTGISDQADKCNSTCSGCLTGFYLDTDSNQCMFNCGNNKIDSLPDGTAEACDDGTANDQLGKCNTACTGCGVDYSVNTTTHQCVLSCGNGIVESTEACDKAGDQANKCNATCDACVTGYNLVNKVCIQDAIPVTTCPTACPVGQQCIAGNCTACLPVETIVTEYTITNSTDETLTDYQVKFTRALPIIPGVGPNEVVNITDEHCNYIPYYTDIVSQTETDGVITAATADVWVKIDSIPATGTGSRTILVSNGTSDSWWPDAPYTFELFEDFQNTYLCEGGTNSGKDCESNIDCPGSTCVGNWLTANNWTIMGAGTEVNNWGSLTFNTVGACNAFVGNILESVSGIGFIQGSTSTTVDSCSSKQSTYLGFTSTKTFTNNFRVLSKLFIPLGTGTQGDQNEFKALLGLNSGVLYLKNNAGQTYLFNYWDDEGKASVNLSPDYFSSAQKQVEVIYSSGKLRLNIDGTDYVDVNITGDYGYPLNGSALNFAYAPDKEGISLFQANFNDIMVTNYRLNSAGTAEAVSISPVGN